MRVGITGHQVLDDPGAWSWVGRVMRQELADIRHSPVGVTSLAVGTDQLFAKVVLERGGSLHVVLPFADIERTFSQEDLADFRELIRYAAAVEEIDVPGTNEDAYLAAGQRVVDLSDVILAVWDGGPAKGKGGTADVVAYATRRGVSLVHINPVSRVVRRQMHMEG